MRVWSHFRHDGPDLHDVWGRLFSWPMIYSRGELSLVVLAFTALSRRLGDAGRIHGGHPYACALPRDRSLRQFRTQFRRIHGRDADESEADELLADLHMGLTLMLEPEFEVLQRRVATRDALGFVWFDAEGDAPPLRRPRQGASCARSPELWKLAGHAEDALDAFPAVWD